MGTLEMIHSSNLLKCILLTLFMTAWFCKVGEQSGIYNNHSLDYDHKMLTPTTFFLVCNPENAS